MEIRFEKPNPKFIIGYDAITQGIYANFLFSDPESIPLHEAWAVQDFANQFQEVEQTFLYQKVDEQLFLQIKSVVLKIILNIYNETGIRFELDDSALTKMSKTCKSWVD